MRKAYGYESTGDCHVYSHERGGARIPLQFTCACNNWRILPALLRDRRHVFVGGSTIFPLDAACRRGSRQYYKPAKRASCSALVKRYHARFYCRRVVRELTYKFARGTSAPQRLFMRFALATGDCNAAVHFTMEVRANGRTGTGIRKSPNRLICFI